MWLLHGAPSQNVQSGLVELKFRRSVVRVVCIFGFWHGIVIMITVTFD